jgi:hypothetical protein
MKFSMTSAVNLSAIPFIAVLTVPQWLGSEIFLDTKSFILYISYDPTVKKHMCVAVHTNTDDLFVFTFSN